MSKTTKKVTAVLLALLLAVQAVPVLADSTYSSGTIVGSQKGYREALEIVASKGTYVLLDQTLLLDVNEGYQPVWSSENESIATVDKTGLVTAVAPGEVKITAEAEGQKATAVVTVIDPDSLMEEAQQEIASDIEQWRGESARIKKLYKSKYDWKVMAKRLADVYEKL